MKEIRFVQTGTASIIGLGLALIICTVLTFFAAAESRVAGIILLITTLSILVCLLAFYKMTVVLTDDKFYFKMGVGLFGKSYPLDSIASCKFVKSSPLYGIGVRMLPNGWMYTVSGFKTIELTFKNSNRIVRIGSDKAETIAALVSERIGATGTVEGSFSGSQKRFIILWATVAAIAIIPLIVIISSGHDSRVVISNDQISIKGTYGLDIPFSQISAIDTLTELPRIKTRTNGMATIKYLKGNFRLQDKTDVKLFIRKRSTPYLRISTNDGIIYLNSSEKGKVQSWYSEILKKIRD